MESLSFIRGSWPFLGRCRCGWSKLQTGQKTHPVGSESSGAAGDQVSRCSADHPPADFCRATSAFIQTDSHMTRQRGGGGGSDLSDDGLASVDECW